MQIAQCINIFSYVKIHRVNINGQRLRDTDRIFYFPICHLFYTSDINNFFLPNSLKLIEPIIFNSHPHDNCKGRHGGTINRFVVKSI